jgi:putative membrane protein
MVWSFFFGLVLASILYVGKQIEKWNAVTIIILIIGAFSAYFITTLQPAIENSSLLFYFIAGALAICAMILPGISGAFILVLLGAYKPVLDAIHNRDIKLIGIVAIGAVVGLLSFSKILRWLFDHHKNYTLAVLTGFILGSLNKIWPWKEALTWRVNSHGIKVPFNEQSISPFSFEGDSQLMMAIILSIIGFAVIILLEKLADISNKE